MNQWIGVLLGVLAGAVATLAGLAFGQRSPRRGRRPVATVVRKSPMDGDGA